MNTKKIFGLVGKNISYSFSRNYFSEKFNLLKLSNHYYQNFDLEKIELLPKIFTDYKKSLIGLNVTIPYKEKVGIFLDEIDEEAKNIGAINTIKIDRSGKKKGFNTDIYGFQKSIEPLLKPFHKKAIILGTGGASKAVAYTFYKLGISYKFISRTPKNSFQIAYNEVNHKVISENMILVNCTPLGTKPNTHLYPNIPYEYLGKNHLLYDLIYNPEETSFLKKGKKQGAFTKNGLEMLKLQAEKSWKIWNK